MILVPIVFYSAYGFTHPKASGARPPSTSRRVATLGGTSRTRVAAGGSGAPLPTRRESVQSNQWFTGGWPAPSARRSVSRVLSRRASVAGMAIHLGRSLPNASRDRPERRRGRPARRRPPNRQQMPPAAPTWSCSRWGLPCRRRCRRRGALLPHHFTLAAHAVPCDAAASDDGAWRCVSVALSLGSPPPGVTRHRASVEPGLSSLRRPKGRKRAAIRPSGIGRYGIPLPLRQTAIPAVAFAGRSPAWAPFCSRFRRKTATFPTDAGPVRADRPPGARMARPRPMRR